jgi:hypothetical protein
MLTLHQAFVRWAVFEKKNYNEFYFVRYPNRKFKYNHKLVKGKTLLSSKEKNNSQGFVDIRCEISHVYFY